MTPQCMGGWCLMRGRCALYHARPNGQPPVERLCEKGKDQPEPVKPNPAPVRVLPQGGGR
jgi:hypothetical protein